LLSKLRSHSSLSDDEIRSLRKGISTDRVLACINFRESIVERVGYGTLSAAFVVHANNKAAFLKTHLTSDGRLALEREVKVLDGLYGKPLSLEFQSIEEPDSDRLWLMMPVFEKNQTSLLPEELVVLLNGLNLNHIQELQPGIINTQQDNIYRLIEDGKSAYLNLSSKNLLAREACTITHWALNLLDRRITDYQPILCHGDLSPVNILRHKGAPILIDWEDAFLGVNDYDYLFWLTFFENRKLYSTRPLQHISIDQDLAKALLVLIVLLKCELSWRRNSWQKNSLSFSDRLFEIYNLN
jgi:Phosphotransferase enzyme family